MAPHDGDQTVDVNTLRRWVVRFSSGDSDVKDKLYSGWPCTSITPQNEWIGFCTLFTKRNSFYLSIRNYLLIDLNIFSLLVCWVLFCLFIYLANSPMVFFQKQAMCSPVGGQCDKSWKRSVSVIVTGDSGKSRNANQNVTIKMQRRYEIYVQFL